MLRIATLALLLVSLPALAAGPVGNAAAGAEKANTCASCHGATGDESLDDTYPRLAGQYPEYLAKALRDYKSGARENAIMAADRTFFCGSNWGLNRLICWLMPRPQCAGRRRAE